MIFKNTNELFTYLSWYYEQNGGKVDISTFNMYLGISKGKDWSYRFYNPVREFINKVNKNDLRLILGVPAYIECKHNCLDCKIKYNETIQRHIDTINILNLNVKIHQNLHLKMYRIGELYISGGINLSASDYLDASFIIKDQEQKDYLKKMFDDTWNSCPNINLDKLKIG
mgnify:CR=1 FL=1